MLNTLTSGISAVQGIGDAFGLGGSDPTKDAQRRIQIDNAAAAALAGSRRDYVQLACWAGAPQGSPLYAEALTLGQVSAGQNCGMPNSVRPYAQRKLAEVDARIAVTPLVTTASNALADAAQQQFIQRARSWLPTVLVIGAVLVAVWYIARKG